jgi:hypothetical protein
MIISRPSSAGRRQMATAVASVWKILVKGEASFIDNQRNAEIPFAMLHRLICIIWISLPLSRGRIVTSGRSFVVASPLWQFNRFRICEATTRLSFVELQTTDWHNYKETISKRDGWDATNRNEEALTKLLSGIPNYYRNINPSRSPTCGQSSSQKTWIAYDVPWRARSVLVLKKP